MSDPLLTALAARLATETTIPEASVLVSRMSVPPPHEDGALVTLRSVSGPGGYRTHNGGEIRERLVQITVRALDGGEASATAETVRTALSCTEATYGAVRLMVVRPIQEPIELPPDGNGRALVAFRIQARYAAAA